MQSRMAGENSGSTHSGERQMGMIKEFKEFAMRGNVMDMAVGVVIGGAFQKIVTSLVTDIINPMIGMVAKTESFSQYKLTLKLPNSDTVLVALEYGKFVDAIVQFTIVAFCLFLVVRGMNAMKRSNADTPPPPAPPTKDQELLMEIRDALKARGA
jgi:large conductance mechanosensitive channel